METQLGLDYTAVFSVLSELVEIGLVVINPSGEMDFASGRARQLLGCGDDLDVDSCHDSVRQALGEIITDVQSGESRSTQRNVRFERAGFRRNLVLECHPIDEGSCSGVLVIVKDAENMRKMAQDLRLSAQFRNTRRLYQAVVHDLRQPISAMLVHLDLLRERLSTTDDGKEKDRPELNSVRVVKNQVTGLNRALTLLLEEIEPSETEERGFSLRDVVEDVVRLIEPQANQQKVELRRSTTNHAARMSGSRQKVKQACLNLAVNALDAMPEGGSLEIRLEVTGKAAVIAFSDSGAGIDPEVLPHIFDMHYTTKDAGTGVGLYVARDVIEKHGGRIEVDTEPNEGTTFRLVLPVSENGS